MAAGVVTDNGMLLILMAYIMLRCCVYSMTAYLASIMLRSWQRETRYRLGFRDLTERWLKLCPTATCAVPTSYSIQQMTSRGTCFKLIL